MKKLLCLASLGAALFSFSAFAADNIAVVDVMAVLQQMPQKEAVAKTLKGEFQSRADSLKNDEKKAKDTMQKLQKDGATMSAADRKKMQDILVKFDEKAEKFAQEYRRRENEEATKLLNRIQDAVKAVAKKDKLSIVLKAESVFYVGDAIDITDKVLKQVK